jgi:VanZ family protein
MSESVSASREVAERAGATPQAGQPTHWDYGLRAVLGMYLVVMVLFTHWPRIELPDIRLKVPMDKWMHYVGYGVLGVLLTWVLWRARQLRLQRAASPALPRERPRAAWLALIWAGVGVFAAIDEATQPLFGRNSDPWDWCSDLLGALSGMLLVVVVVRWRGRRTVKLI